MLGVDSFKVLSVGRAHGSHFLVRLQYQYPYGSSPVPVHSGWVLLDPEACWCVRAYAVESRFTESLVVKAEGKHEYEKDASGFPLLKRLTEHVTVLDGSKTTADFEDNYSFSCRAESGIPESEFTLSAFGLPEPYGVEFERPRRTPWIFLGALACLALALVFGWVARNRRRSARGVAVTP
jgi:hypothetical protein